MCTGVLDRIYHALYVEAREQAGWGHRFTVRPSSSCRWLAKDFENLTRSKIAFVKLAMIRLLIRRIARP
jgi:hypothetical protein